MKWRRENKNHCKFSVQLKQTAWQHQGLKTFWRIINHGVNSSADVFYSCCSQINFHVNKFLKVKLQRVWIVHQIFYVFPSILVEDFPEGDWLLIVRSKISSPGMQNRLQITYTAQWRAVKEFPSENISGICSRRSSTQFSWPGGKTMKEDSTWKVQTHHLEKKQQLECLW